MATGRRTGSGGWFKSWDDEIEDAKVDRMSDFEFKVWRFALNFCNRSPARLRRQGYLFHSPMFPVEARDFARSLHRDVKDVTEALGRLCRIGGKNSPLLVESKHGAEVYRVRNWRKRQGGRTRTRDRAVTRPGQRGAGGDKTRRARRSDVDVRRSDLRRSDGQTEEGGHAPAAGAAVAPRPTWPAEADALKSIAGYPFSEDKDRALMDALAVAYSDVDLAHEIRKLNAWLVNKALVPLRGQTRPRTRVRNWIENADRFARNDESRGRAGTDRGAPRRQGPARPEDFGETGPVTL